MSQDPIEAMMAPSAAALAMLGREVASAGVEANRLYGDVATATAALPGLARQIVADAEAIRNDLKLPQEYRDQAYPAKLAEGRKVLKSVTDAAYAKAKELQAHLGETLLPAPSADPHTRTRATANLDKLLAGDPTDLVSRMISQLHNPTYAAEMLSEYGSTAMQVAGVTPQEQKMFRSAAIGLLSLDPSGTPQQKAAKLAWRSMQANERGGRDIVGRVSAFGVAANQILERSTGTKPTTMLQFDILATRGAGIGTTETVPGIGIVNKKPGR